MAKSIKWASAFVVLAVGALPGSAGCSGGDGEGACVHTIKSDGFQYCNDDWDKSDCDTIGSDSETRAFHEGDTCDELGFPYYCKSTFTNHRNSSRCD